MPEIEVDITQSVQENANTYYQKAKKARQKLQGLKKAIQETTKTIEEEKNKQETRKETEKIQRKRKRHWFEKYHWFKTSEGKLVIAGRDAKSNEALVKKHLEDNDYYCHADVQGAPHTVIKNGQENFTTQERKECAQFAAVYSKAWKSGSVNADVYFANPEQVSKKAQAGEFLATGAFMIRGEREWEKNTPLKISFGLIKHEGSELPACAPETALKENGKVIAKIKPQGKMSKSDAAKVLKKKLKDSTITLDDIISVLPNDNITLEF